MIEDKANICVSCGSPSALTLHHIGKEQFEQMVPQIEKSSDPIYLTVPDMYRKWMPEVIKSKSVSELSRACELNVMLAAFFTKFVDIVESRLGDPLQELPSEIRELCRCI